MRAGAAFLAVQVHNRGAFTTSTAKVAVLWAPADAGPPPLPDAIRAQLGAAAAIAVGTRFGDWTVVADGPFPDPNALGHDRLAPGYPRVFVVGASAAFAWAAGDLGTHTRVGLLALVRSTEDPLAVTTNDVLELVRSEPKAAYRECRVVDAASDGLDRAPRRARRGPARAGAERRVAERDRRRPARSASP